MHARRTVILIAAVVVAFIAAIAVYSYLTTVQDRANKDAKLVKIFVVDRDINKGTPGEQALEEGLIKPGNINVRYRPTTALVDVNVVRGKIAVNKLAANQVVVEDMFVDPRVEQVTSAERIPTGNVAVTVQFTPESGVANLVQPGDKVNLLLNRGTEEAHLLQNVNVLFVGQQAAPQPGETVAAQQAEQLQGNLLLTFSVTPQNAARIAFARSSGEGGIYLTLVPPDYQVTEVPPINNDNLIATNSQTG